MHRFPCINDCFGRTLTVTPTGPDDPFISDSACADTCEAVLETGFGPKLCDHCAKGSIKIAAGGRYEITWSGALMQEFELTEPCFEHVGICGIAVAPAQQLQASLWVNTDAVGCANGDDDEECDCQAPEGGACWRPDEPRYDDALAYQVEFDPRTATKATLTID